MSKISLCGLESKPKLNGKEVSLVKYHDDRGRWEVELLGSLPMVDIFTIDWNDDWYEPLDEDKYPSLRKEKGPTFKEILDGKIEKFKLADTLLELKVVDCNGRRVCVFDADGKLLEELAGGHIPRQGNDVNQKSFPITFQKDPPDRGTLAVRPSNLKFREDDSVEKLRLRKVEMAVGANHAKPALDGQFGELGPFQASAHRWEVRPDSGSLWDVKVDGSPAPVLMKSTEVCDESTGTALIDPVKFAAWEHHQDGQALFATVDFAKGQVILEDEPSLFAPSDLDLMRLWHQSKQMAPEKNDILQSLCKGSDVLTKLCPGQELTRKAFLTASDDFQELKPNQQDLAWDLFRRVDHNGFSHSRVKGGHLLYLALARVNHSCKPNSITADPKLEVDSKRNGNGMTHDTFKKALIAQVPIHAGDEITISYLSDDELLEPTERRQRTIRDRWGFTCVCDRCRSEESDALLRTFCCTGGAPCKGTHGGSGTSLSACSVCGVVASQVETRLSDEKMHVDAYLDFMKNNLSDRILLQGKALPSLDPLVGIVEAAAMSGLAQSHWLVSKARFWISLIYEQDLRSGLTFEHLQPVLELEERVLGKQNSGRVELLADQLVNSRSLAEAFGYYVSVLQAVKLASPNQRPGDSDQCNRIRQKIRGVLDGGGRAAILAR
eukprot:TRINITY_DN26586_c0_g1_i2.p1 TRINITY_DN26586_c0_g1~~TRINITY_DN26586_c0_g1_i2.p1  ORF type:complete len:664 (+),score=115.70 TRINITY_DN26586_c0_g1_i2:87-2078(+)